MATYCTPDQWAIKQSSESKTYENFDDYAASEDYPTKEGLEDILEEVTSIMNYELGNVTGTNVTNALYTTLLRNICYRGAQNFIDLEQARAQQRPERAQFIPKDYINERDRLRLRDIGRIVKYRRRAKVVF